MSNENKVRLAHDVLDGLFEGRILSRENEQLLRSFLPELPKQKTLEEIAVHVYGALLGTSGNDWTGDKYDADVTLEAWLSDLHAQLKGLMDTPATVPALPAGMRLADHENFGRVVTSPKPNRDGIYDLLVPKPKFETGADWEYAHECELTFIDAEPAKSAHPEFLETEADYQDAPEGTIVASSGRFPWVKGAASGWACSGSTNSDFAMSKIGRRNVLRWGWGDK